MSGKHLKNPKVLIANRGEIALRVMRSCKKLGIPTVAVYSEADRDTLPVIMADQAVLIGPAATNLSYLSIDNIIKACRETGANAIHPGFGFLSENEDFAERCGKEGIIFVGPSPSCIASMGDKIQARIQMKKAGVPIVPGTVEPLKDIADAKKVAKSVGYPVMLKATAGGGGKGMRKVDDESQMDSLYEAAQSEAQKFFANGDLYLEKFIVGPHHIEVQIFGYGKDHAIHLFERECSVQRRHQKVIEEACSPLIDESRREKLTKVAVDGAKAIGYEGAGTMEFVADSQGNFYFMEMNTRLQVEHSVTEWITGADIVEEQLRLALGMPCLLKDQKSLIRRGHSLQCRIYAEDPVKFFPSPGPIAYARWPQGPWVRVDTAIETGSEVTMHYDPMIAKISTWGRTRDEAIEHMKTALSETIILGIETNIPFHQAVLDEKVFRSGNTTTSFIDEVLPQSARKKKLASASSEELKLAAQLALEFSQAQSQRTVVIPKQTSKWQDAGLKRNLREPLL